jgi:uncharacterized protein
VIAGGSGQLGSDLAQALTHDGTEVLILSRHTSASKSNVVQWDGQTLGPWKTAIDGADVVINLAGHTVNCVYTPVNRRQIMDSRVGSVRAIGQAIAEAQRPPKVWLQMSTATIYSHRYDAPNDEFTGIFGGDEVTVPESWRFSVRVAQAWEKAFDEARTPKTRKVTMRTAMVMSARAGSVFDIFRKLVRMGLGGSMAGGRQYVSWIHSYDFERAVKRLIKQDNLDGAFNICAPHPIPNADFMHYLRSGWRMPIGLPSTVGMVEFGAKTLKTETELVLKSRRVVPARLLKNGFEFVFPTWPKASEDLVAEWRRRYGKHKEK